MTTTAPPRKVEAPDPDDDQAPAEPVGPPSDADFRYVTTAGEITLTAGSRIERDFNMMEAAADADLNKLTVLMIREASKDHPENLPVLRKLKMWEMGVLFDAWIAHSRVSPGN